MVIEASQSLQWHVSLIKALQLTKTMQKRLLIDKDDRICGTWKLLDSDPFTKISVNIEHFTVASYYGN